MLSVALQGVVAQQLLPTADGSGRVAAVEILVPTPAVRNLIREGKTHQIYSAIQTGAEHGMQTMDAALADLVRAGRITRDVAQRRASVPAELARLLGGGAVAPGRRRERVPAMSASYVFRAVDGLGVKHKGEIEAESAAGVTELLKGRGLIALEVKAKTKSMELSFDQFTRVTLEDLALMTRQLSTMISSGLSLMRALIVLESQTQNKRLRATVVSDPSGHRDRRSPCRAPGQAPQDLLRAVRRDDPRRRDRRVPGERAAFASPTSSRPSTSCAVRSSRRWSTRPS